MYLKAELVDAQTAYSIIVTKDDYISIFSEFDLQSRLRTSEKVSKEDLVEVLSKRIYKLENKI